MADRRDEQFEGAGGAQQGGREQGELGQQETPSGPSTSTSAKTTDGSDFAEGDRGVLDEEDPASGSGSGEGD